MQTLDVRYPDQVGSISRIEADLGAGGRRLLVLSGIAMTNWEVDSDQVHFGETHVRLGAYASNMDQCSAFVGFASLSNDETPFAFGLEDVKVELDGDTGELVLIFKPALMGEPSAIHRVSYQVVVTITQIQPSIAGVITWSRDIFEPPDGDVANVADQLEVMANRYERVTPADGFAYDKLTPVKQGRIVRLEPGPNDWVAHYRIDDPPMATPLRVTVNPGPKFAAPPPNAIVVGRSAGPDVFTLTGSVPTVTGLNFVISVAGIR